MWIDVQNGREKEAIGTRESWEVSWIAPMNWLIFFTWFGYWWSTARPRSSPSPTTTQTPAQNVSDPCRVWESMKLVEKLFDLLDDKTTTFRASSNSKAVQNKIHYYLFTQPETASTKRVQWIKIPFINLNTFPMYVLEHYFESENSLDTRCSEKLIVGESHFVMLQTSG